MIEIKRSTARHTKGQFYFHVKGRNGKILVTSECYKRKASVYKAIRATAHQMAPAYRNDNWLLKYAIKDLTESK